MRALALAVAGETGWEQSAVTLLTFIPAVGAIVVALLPRGREQAAKVLGVLFSGAALVIGIAVLFGFDYGSGGGLQFEQHVTWIKALGAGYHVGLDGINLPLVELTLLTTFLCAVYTLNRVPPGGSAKAFVSLMLLLETGMLGTFVAFDLVLFFVFWEMVLVPMYFMIGVWGSGNRSYAATKFFLFTFFGSVFMLLAFIGVAFQANPHTFDIQLLSANGNAIAHGIQLLLFAGMFLGFAVKVPMWPLHTWLPDAHTEAPTVGSVLLAGVLLKMGGYGFIRIAFPLLPYAARQFAPWIAVLAVIAIVYASLACLAQRDLKRLIAYSSVGHMGFVMLGISTMTAVGINAAIFGMVAHGVITGMLFFEVGSIYDRYHTRQLSELGGGMMKVMPRMGAVFWLTCIASLGLPGLAGFWGEVLALFAAFNPAAGLNVGLYRTLMV
ncbi:MAG TPA: NADH-quinone oxidoreductase subunit M, partial [Actinomycetota bacterium]|nr:NADH-quinone oxidoreductase subunit M [Actinomycetota bacterium]